MRRVTVVDRKNVRCLERRRSSPKGAAVSRRVASKKSARASTRDDQA
jgi:hypothetical protein